MTNNPKKYIFLPTLSKSQSVTTNQQLRYKNKLFAKKEQPTIKGNLQIKEKEKIYVPIFGSSWPEKTRRSLRTRRRPPPSPSASSSPTTESPFLHREKNSKRQKNQQRGGIERRVDGLGGDWSVLGKDLGRRCRRRAQGGCHVAFVGGVWRFPEQDVTEITELDMALPLGKPIVIGIIIISP